MRGRLQLFLATARFSDPSPSATGLFGSSPNQNTKFATSPPSHIVVKVNFLHSLNAWQIAIVVFVAAIYLVFVLAVVIHTVRVSTDLAHRGLDRLTDHLISRRHLPDGSLRPRVAKVRSLGLRGSLLQESVDRQQKMTPLDRVLKTLNDKDLATLSPAWSSIERSIMESERIDRLIG